MRKIIPVVAAGAALAVTAAGAGYAALDKDVTVSVDGQERTVSTTAGTVGELLAEEGITVTDRDVVAPTAGTEVGEGTRVAVQFARPVTFDVDGKPRTIWTTATSLDQALRALDVNTAGAALSTSRSAAIGRQGLDVDVRTLKTVTVTADGKKRQVKTTGTRVADALAAAKIKVDRDDKLSAKPTAALTSGAAITFTRVDVKTVTEKEKVSFDTVRKNTSSLTRGTTEVDTAGRSGTRTITYREVREDGDVVSRTRTASTITRQPRDRVVLVGTKAPKVSEPDDSGSSGSGSSGSGSSAPAVASGGVWDRLADCESSGNWSINTGNGFYGGLQFTLSTWRGYGGTGMPHQASRAEQIAVAKRVQAGQGWGAWPACTAKLGIR